MLALLWVYYVLLLRNEYLTIFEASFTFVVTRKLLFCGTIFSLNIVLFPYLKFWILKEKKKREETKDRRRLKGMPFRIRWVL